MPHPIIGIGHSVGASHLTHLSHLHPRLLHSLILIDPIIQQDIEIHKTLARLSTSRRDTWPSRETAAEAFRNSKFYQAWDPRVLEQWIRFGLRDLPTEQYPDDEVIKPHQGEDANNGPNKSDSCADVPVTLITTVAQEVYFYVRARYRDKRLLQEGEEDFPDNIHPAESGLDHGHGAADPQQQQQNLLSRPESRELFRLLPHLKPNVQYIFGAQSPASTPSNRLAKMATTGTGVGGSGGAQAGCVREVVLDCGHLVGFEAPAESARASADFVHAELGRWEARERARDGALEGLGRRERVGINERWRESVGVKVKVKLGPQGRL